MDRTEALDSLEFAKQFEAMIEGPKSRELSQKFEPRHKQVLAALAWFAVGYHRQMRKSCGRTRIELTGDLPELR